MRLAIEINRRRCIIVSLVTDRPMTRGALMVG